MTALDFLDSPHLHEVQAFATHRMKLTEASKKARLRGVIWVNSFTGWREIIEEANEVLPNTIRENLMIGDYGGVHLDDGYWIVCQARA